MHLPTLVYLAPASACVLSWLGVGLAVPPRALSGEALLDRLTRIAFGSVVVSLVVLAVGRAGLLDRPLLLALTGLGAAAGVFAAPMLFRELRRASVRGRLDRVLLLAVAVALVLDLVAATAPVSSADALAYHLGLPRLWLQTGSIGDPFWRWEGFNPSGIEMLYTQGLALGGGSAAAPLHAVFAVTSALAVFGLGREVGGSALAGSVGAFLFVLQGIVTWEATSAFVELGLTFYAVLSIWHAVRWGRGAGTRAALWTGFFAGAAAGTKYLGLPVLAIVLASVVVVAVRRGRVAHIVVSVAAALAAGGWWYLKNLLATGNPVYPLVFGGKWLTPYSRAVIHQSLSAYGVGGGIARLPILPVDLLVHGGAFDRGRYVGTAIFLCAALALLTHRTRLVGVLLLGVLVYVVAWHEQSPQARFLLPALAVLAAVGGVGATPWLQGGGPRRLAVLVALGCGAAVWLGASGALTRQLLPPALGIESRAGALQRLTGTYDAFLAARQRAGPGTVGLVDYRFAFNFPGRALSIDVPEFTPLLGRDVYLARLRSLGVHALLVGGSDTVPAELAPVAGCLKQTAVFHARFVTSRSLGRGTPFDLALYSLVGCEG